MILEQQNSIYLIPILFSTFIFYIILQPNIVASESCMGMNNMYFLQKMWNYHIKL